MAEGRKEAISEFPACFLAERVGHQVLCAVAARHPNVSLYLFTRLLHPQHLDERDTRFYPLFVKGCFFGNA